MEYKIVLISVKRKSETANAVKLTRGLFCTCESGVARCQSKQVNEFAVRSLVYGHVSLPALNLFRTFIRFKNLKVH